MWYFTTSPEPKNWQSEDRRDWRTITSLLSLSLTIYIHTHPLLYYHNILLLLSAYCSPATSYGESADLRRDTDGLQTHHRGSASVGMLALSSTSYSRVKAADATLRRTPKYVRNKIKSLKKPSLETKAKLSEAMLTPSFNNIAKQFEAIDRYWWRHVVVYGALPVMKRLARTMKPTDINIMWLVITNSNKWKPLEISWAPPLPLSLSLYYHSWQWQ